VNRAADLVSEDEVLVELGGPGKGALGRLNFAVLAQNAHGFLVKGHRVENGADRFRGGAGTGPPREGVSARSRRRAALVAVGKWC
jgi:hypothetical protein